MGTDIHLYVEKYEPCAEWNNEAREYSGRWELMIHEDAAYGSRNYDVFAILADVRNGRGFAGVETGMGFGTIAMPRGLPEDLSPELKRILDEGIEHTPHWLTLKEIVDFDWKQMTTHYGVVDAAEFAWMKKHGARAPRAWCGGISGANVRHVSESEMAALILASDIPARLLETPRYQREPLPPEFRWLENTVTRTSWRETYAESASDFLQWIREEFYTPWRGMNFVAEDRPERIRFVMYFDS